MTASARSPLQWGQGLRRRDLLALLALLALVFWARGLPFTLPSLDARAVQLAQAEAVASGAAAATPARVNELADALRERHFFQGDDGARHAYLTRWDSYSWVRTARNRIEHGSPCDEIVDGSCRDALVVAPWGKAHIYAESLHIDAIVLLHRIASVLAPGYPIASSALWVQLLLGVLAVIPAFLLGQRLGGSAGGLIAGVLVSLEPSLMARTIGADNDIWNFALLLTQQWLLLVAVLARRRRTAWAAVLLAAACTWLWSLVWAGWHYGYLLACITLIGAVGLSLFTGARARVQKAATLLALYYLAVGVLLMLSHPGVDYLGLLPGLIAERLPG